MSPKSCVKIQRRWTDGPLCLWHRTLGVRRGEQPKRGTSGGCAPSLVRVGSAITRPIPPQNRTGRFPSSGSSAPHVSRRCGGPTSPTTRVLCLRPPASTTAPSCSPCSGPSPALSPPLHALGPRQRGRRHHPPNRAPRHRPASPAVPPIPPGARCRRGPQGEAWAVTPQAGIRGVPAPLRTQEDVLCLGGTVAVGPAPAPARAQGAAAPRALRLPLDGVAAAPGCAPGVDPTQHAAGTRLAIG
jgi:hypothetical protein